MLDQHAATPRTRGDSFAFGAVTHEGTKAHFAFECSRYGSFVETVDFGAPGEVSSELLTLLHVALGVSTYKAAAAHHITWPTLSPAGRVMAEALYTDGLAEFFVRSDLPYPPKTTFAGDVLALAPSDRDLSVGGTPLVAFGGGKDSYVAGAIAERALGTKPTYASVILSDAVGDVLTKTAPYPPLLIKRALDPKLLALKDGFSGHVPITAINILVLTIAGMLRGSGPILFANERSADEPTMVVYGVPANHQYSKSSEFEGLVRAAVAEVAPEAPPTYSVLRPFSELWIAQRFSALKEPFGRFTSCNRNFRLAGDAASRWCGACAKCAFTSLILSPFLTKNEAVQAFGGIFLDREPLQEFYRELCGLSDQKPWDCVGTIDECRAALYLLHQHADWKDTEVVHRLYPEVLAVASEEQLRQKIESALAPTARGALPENLYQAALELPCVSSS
ncbi:MAG: hypothetical protein AAF830_04145 [Pseudomonadota bacterium]